jgi:hypothetical protein
MPSLLWLTASGFAPEGNFIGPSSAAKAVVETKNNANTVKIARIFFIVPLPLLNQFITL